MKAEMVPISDDEYLLRRVHRTLYMGKFTSIKQNAFEPRCQGRDIDTDGISMYRESCLALITDALATIPTDKRKDTGIVRIPVVELKKLNLTVELKPVATVLGHVVIPELSSTKYLEDKPLIKAIMLALAQIASEERHMVLLPSDS